MLDQINPVLDPSAFLLPVSPNFIFENNKPTALEIGFGEGEFITHLSSNKLDWNFIGIEIKRGRFKKAVNKANTLALQNLKLVNIEAKIALKQIFERNSFDTVYINFPDPWPKNKHSKHRLFNYNFIKYLSKVITNSGRVKLKTDHYDYIAKIVNEFDKTKLFSNNFQKNGFIRDKSNKSETKFEEEFKGIGKEIYFTTFTNLSY